MTPIPARELLSKTICGSFERAWTAGHAVLQAKKNKTDPADALLEAEKGSKFLVRGKVDTNLLNTKMMSCSPTSFCCRSSM